MAPLALGITALATVILGDYAKAQAVAERLSEGLPRNVHEEIVQLILRTHRDSPLLIAGSIVGMLWTSSGAVGVLERTLARLLGAADKGAVLGKLRQIGVAAAVTLLVVIMVLVASAGTGVVRELGLNSTLTRIALPIASIALTALPGAHPRPAGERGWPDQRSDQRREHLHHPRHHHERRGAQPAATRL